MLHFCTYFDHRYLSRALALHASLQRHCKAFTLWALCLSDESYTRIQQLGNPDIRAISLEEFEAADPEFHACKATRTQFEYFLTGSPCLPRHLLMSHPEIDAIHYIDADLYFFEDPQRVVDEIQGHSVAITPHRFPKRWQDRAKQFGTYNVGWLTFRNDSTGLACLEWWRSRCIEWCHCRIEENRFADQKYLDEFEHRFPNVKSIENKGANLAPWNLENYRISPNGTGVLVDEDPLIFFHYSGIRHLAKKWYQCASYHYDVQISPNVRKYIYRPYLLDIVRIESQLRNFGDMDASLHLISKDTGIRKQLRFVFDAKALLIGMMNGNLVRL
jgi:hypothetical protein